MLIVCCLCDFAFSFLFGNTSKCFILTLLSLSLLQPSEFSNEQREVSQFVERKAAQVVQDALDTAERTRQGN